MAKIKITWMSDGAGVDSIHENGPKMAKDSYLGHITRIEDEWFFVQAGVQKPHGPYGSMAEVRRAALKIVDGEYI
jgi:hypothetical protein